MGFVGGGRDLEDEGAKSFDDVVDRLHDQFLRNSRESLSDFFRR
jgi:hypothetical protein